eukprot:s6456_g1.t1
MGWDGPIGGAPPLRSSGVRAAVMLGLHSSALPGLFDHSEHILLPEPEDRAERHLSQLGRDDDMTTETGKQGIMRREVSSASSLENVSLWRSCRELDLADCCRV